MAPLRTAEEKARIKEQYDAICPSQIQINVHGCRFNRKVINQGSVQCDCSNSQSGKIKCPAKIRYNRQDRLVDPSVGLYY